MAFGRGKGNGKLQYSVLFALDNNADAIDHFDVDDEEKMWIPVDSILLMSAVGMAVTYKIIPNLRDMFIKAGIFGIDLSKKKPRPPESPAKVPEATGVVTGCVFLMITILLIPLTFSKYLVSGNSDNKLSGEKTN
jgi:hypothetical protein